MSAFCPSKWRDVEITADHLKWLAAGAGVLAVGALGYWAVHGGPSTPCSCVKRPRANEVVGKVEKIVIFPVKSSRGIEVDSAVCTKRGFQHDRRYVVVNGNATEPATGDVGTFQNLLKTPKLAHIQPVLVEAGGHVSLVLQADGHDSVTVTQPDPATAKHASLYIYRMTGECLDCGDAVASWLSTVLDMSGARLYYLADDMRTRMIADDSKWGDLGRPGQETSLANYSPYMLCTEQSRVDISQRVNRDLEMSRFRPNIIVSSSTAQPYQEDNWTEFRIADVDFYTMKKCGRCPMTTLDPITGEKTGAEPLQTLREYRIETSDTRYGNAPIFGIQIASVQDEGTISIGDEVVMR